VGINRGVKKIVTSKVPNLGRLEDVADLLIKGGAVSESEAEVRHFLYPLFYSEGCPFCRNLFYGSQNFCPKTISPPHSPKMIISPPTVLDV
jgi:hypothetical protein